MGEAKKRELQYLGTLRSSVISLLCNPQRIGQPVLPCRADGIYQTSYGEYSVSKVTPYRQMLVFCAATIFLVCCIHLTLMKLAFFNMLI